MAAAPTLSTTPALLQKLVDLFQKHAGMFLTGDPLRSHAGDICPGFATPRVRLGSQLQLQHLVVVCVLERFFTDLLLLAQFDNGLGGRT